MLKKNKERKKTHKVSEGVKSIYIERMVPEIAQFDNLLKLRIASFFC